VATRRTTTRITARVEHDRGVFMISVAAELAEMHPQTLRMYEQREAVEKLAESLNGSDPRASILGGSSAAGSAAGSSGG